MASSIFPTYGIAMEYAIARLPLLVCSKVGGEQILHIWYKASKTSQHPIDKAIVFHTLDTKRKCENIFSRR